MARLCSDLPTLVSAIKLSTKLQLSPDESMLRRIQPLPPYDQLKDAHRSLFVDHLPPSSNLKSVKKLFSVFGKVTYVLRADQIASASTLNSSPRLSPMVAPASPGVQSMPRLSLSTSQPLSSSLIVPSSSASDSVDGVFTSAFVQFEKQSSMESAVELIKAQQAAHRAAKANGTGSPALGRRSLEFRSASPALSSRALGLAAGDRITASPVPHIHDVIVISSPLAMPRSSQSASSPPLVALPPSALGSGSADTPIPILDLGGGHALSRPSTPNTPQSPSLAPIDPSIPLPAVFLTVNVQTKGDYLQALEEKAEKATDTEKEKERVKEKEKKKENNWRRAAESPRGSITIPAAASNGSSPAREESKEERFPSKEPTDPLLVRMKEDAARKQRTEEVEREKERERDKEYRRLHLSERNQERAAAKELHKAVEKAAELDGILHISPRPSPVLRPTPSPIQISHSPVLSFLGGGGASPSLQSLSPSPSIPHMELAKPRFSLTKRTSIVASSVASHFALGPDGPDSRGFNGRGRGKILPLHPANAAASPASQPVGPPVLHLL